MKNNKLFQEWIEMNKQIKELSEKADSLKKTLVGIAINEGIPEVQGGKFILAVRKSWSYSDAIKNLEESLKSKKATEQESGVATFEQEAFLTFRQDKSK